MASYFSVKNFSQFQHYKDRKPPWIKLYNSLLEDYEFTFLPDASKIHLMMIWLLASQMDNKIPRDSNWISRKIFATEPVDLDLLFDTGFLVPFDPAEQLATQNDWASRHVPEKLRAKIHERDGGRCVACSSVKNIEVDHIIPVSKGGTSVEENLQLLCRSCNRRKRTSVTAEQLATQGNKQRSLETETETETETEGDTTAPGGGSPGDRPPIATEQNRVDKIKNKTTTTAPGGAAPQDGIATVLPLAENTPAPPNGGTPTELVASDPKPPAENASPVHVLSWNIFEGRKHLYDDQFYDPWNRKALGICKTLIEKKARGDFTEVLKRLRVLFVKCASAPPGSDYWAFTPENFTSKWSQLVDDPRLRIEKPSREALARAGYEERIRALTQEMRDETT